MKKAYDLKELVEGLKSDGLDLTEDAARKLLKRTFGWVRESAQLSDTKIDDMVAPLLAPIEVYILGQVDEINGKKG